MRVGMWSGFDRFTGYGNDAVDIAVNLEAVGVDVVPWPSYMTSGLPRAFTRLLEKEPVGKYDVAFQFAPPFDIHPEKIAAFGKVAVGYSMWEKTPLLRADMEGHEWKNASKRRSFWSKPLHRTTRKEWLDLMMVTCPMNVDAFKALDPHLTYSVLPCGIELGDWPLMDHGHPDGRMRFGMIGMLAGRKDPYVMLQAWRELKEEHPEFDAVLELKTACPGLHPKMLEAYPDIVLYEVAWPRQQVVDWYGTIDVLVSTSRGEGNNKPAMEFMATGGPVMATDWSGHQNWLHEDWGYPLSGDLVYWPGGVIQDFRVHKDVLKARLLEAWGNRAEVKRKGRLSHGVITSRFAWPIIAREMARTFERLL